MKKAVLSILIFTIAVSAAAAKDPRLSAMGNIGIGVSGTNMQSYPNPAAVYFDKNDFTFAIRGNLEDTAGAETLPYKPGAGLNILFVAEMITMGIDVSLYSNLREEKGHADLYQASSLNLNFSAGYENFSAGFGISGGSVQHRLDVPMTSVSDFIMQTLLAQYERVVNSEFIQVNAGFMFKYRQFSVGVLLDNILDKNGSDTVLMLKNMFSETGIGVYWSRDEYSSRGRMNNFVYSFAAEMNYLFDYYRRSVSAGTELKFRFVRDSSISLRLGYSAKLVDIKGGTLTAGIGLTYRKFEAAFNLEKPYGGQSRLKLCGTILF
ncbi:MAG: hypothetical protein ACTTJW_05260 [Sphaerochaeta sp.]